MRNYSQNISKICKKKIPLFELLKQNWKVKKIKILYTSY